MESITTSLEDIILTRLIEAEESLAVATGLLKELEESCTEKTCWLFRYEDRIREALLDIRDAIYEK